MHSSSDSSRFHSPSKFDAINPDQFQKELVDLHFCSSTISRQALENLGKRGRGWELPSPHKYHRCVYLGEMKTSGIGTWLTPLTTVYLGAAEVALSGGWRFQRTTNIKKKNPAAQSLPIPPILIDLQWHWHSPFHVGTGHPHICVWVISNVVQHFMTVPGPGGRDCPGIINTKPATHVTREI